MSDALSVARALCEAFNAGDVTAYGELLDDDVEVRVDGQTLRGRETVCNYLAAVRHTFRGVMAVPERTFAGGEGTRGGAGERRHTRLRRHVRSGHGHA